jgi:hypothetical protein
MQLKQMGDKVRLTYADADDRQQTADLSVAEALCLLGEPGPRGTYASPALVGAIRGAQHEAAEATRVRIEQLSAQIAKLREELPRD